MNLITLFSAHWLFGVALPADNLGDSMAVNLVCQVLLVVTQPTGVHLTTAWRLDRDKETTFKVSLLDLYIFVNWGE